MDVEQLKEDIGAGRITADHLVELVVILHRELLAAKKRIEEFERHMNSATASGVKHCPNFRECSLAPDAAYRPVNLSVIKRHREEFGEMEPAGDLCLIAFAC